MPPNLPLRPVTLEPLEAEQIATTANILVVEDDENILNLLSAYLESAGHRVAVHRDGQDAIAAALTQSFDICIFDVMLPRKSGTEVAAELRQHGFDTPVVFLTALAGEAEVLRGFEAGADDYMVKPFSPRELVVRIDAILRRSRSSVDHVAEALEVGPVRLDADQPRCIVAGAAISLTPYEHKILRRLLERPNRVLAREQLIANLYGNESAVGPKAIDVHVHNLRTKLGDDMGRMIETVRGFGYRFSPAASHHILAS